LLLVLHPPIFTTTRHLFTNGQALTSFECDGCGHHASFHNLENKQEDAILKRWEEEAKEKDIQVLPERAAKKRRRAIEGPKNGTTSNRPLQRTEVFEIQEEDVD